MSDQVGHPEDQLSQVTAQMQTEYISNFNNKVGVWGLGKMSRIARKRDYCLCQNKGADQLRGNREADQRLCFRYLDSTIPLLPICKISSFKPASVAAQTGLCQTRSETPKTGFLASRLKYNYGWNVTESLFSGNQHYHAFFDSVSNAGKKYMYMYYYQHV